MILYDTRGNKYNFVKAQRRFQHYGVNGYLWDSVEKTVDGRRYIFWYEVGRGTLPGGVGELFETRKLFTTRR